MDDQQQTQTTQDDDSLEAWQQWAEENLDVWIDYMVNE